MKKNLKYSDIAGLPADHPDSIEFIRQLKELDDCYATDNDYGNTLDEEGQEYFDRYIAGDRK